MRDTPERDIGARNVEMTQHFIVRLLSDGSYDLTNRSFEGSHSNWTLNFSGKEAAKFAEKLKTPLKPTESMDRRLTRLWKSSKDRVTDLRARNL